MPDLFEAANSIPPEFVHPCVGVTTSLIAGLPVGDLDAAMQESFLVGYQTFKAAAETDLLATNYLTALQKAEERKAGATENTGTDAAEKDQAARETAESENSAISEGSDRLATNEQLHARLQNESEDDEAVRQAADEIARSVPDTIPYSLREVGALLVLATKVRLERRRLGRPYRAATAIGGLALGLGIGFGLVRPAAEHFIPEAKAAQYACELGSSGIAGSLAFLASDRYNNRFARLAARRQVRAARKIGT